MTSVPGTGCTTAATRWPQRSSGTPTTSTSYTAGWSLRTDSTSSGCTFSPPVLMHTDPRPSSTIVPSASTVAMSPVMTWRTPLTSTKVAAVLSGALW